MHSRHATSRWALWAFVAALLLKAAMPWLASAAAAQQGKALVEVCTAYGVALKAPGGGEPSHAPGDDPSTAHAGEHCVLSALAALATPGAPPRAIAAVAAPVRIAPSPRPGAARPDASAAWAARLRHAPPTLA